MKILSLINGRKTIVGAVFLLLHALGVQDLFPAEYADEISTVLQDVGSALTGVGLLHKGVKKVEEKKGDKPS